MGTKKPIVALMYDFDKTLCTKDMQEYTFIPSLGIDSQDFWNESNAMAKEKKMDRILAYMYLMIDKSKIAHHPIRREDFVKLGKDVEFFDGVVNWFDRINYYGREHGIKIEHYIISSGLKEIIEGSQIKKFLNEIYACEFHYDENGVADWPLLSVNYTAKTQFLFRINKGILDISNDDELNKYVEDDERRVPFRNMVYIGDGLTDVPCMKLVKVNGGYSIAVYKKKQKQKVEDLLRHNRVNFVTLADYGEGSELDIIIKKIIDKISIVNDLVILSQKQIKLLSH
jgi:2-hydroxy-3-keto-5-methylthiopentenyl-1-phosphate phosphatase